MSGAAREAAGCVVFRRLQEEQEVLLIWIKGRDSPRLPKGGVEPGESYEQCAVREVMEETGYRVAIDHPLPVVVHAGRDRRPPYFRQIIRFYIASVLDGSPDMRTDAELVSRVDWLPVDKALKELNFPEEAEALRLCSLTDSKRAHGREEAAPD